MKVTSDAQHGAFLLPTHAIRQRAEQLEFQEVKKFHIISTSLIPLGELLDEVYTMLKPSLKDYEARKTLIAFVDKFAKQKISGSCISGSGPSVRAFGSYTMDLFTAESDLDLSVSLGYTGDAFPRENKIPVLRKLTKALYGLQGGGRIHKIQPILKAIVPVLKFVDCRSGIECDISIENKDGILKSELLNIFSSIDERFQKLCFLMKAWAKAHNINSSKDRTLNSLSIILLVAFHLQTRSPPILPPFSVFLKDGSNIADVERRVLRFKYFGNHNHECIPELFISLLCKLLSVESLWEQGLCASTYEGSWISKTRDDNRGCINVEDFTDRSQNAARSVGKRECEIIYKCIRESLSHLQQYMTSQSEASNLKAFLFDPLPKLKNAVGEALEAKHLNSKKRSIPPKDIVNQKRMRPSKDVVKREDSAAVRFPAIQSGDQVTQIFPRATENIVRNAVSTFARYTAPPEHGYDQWQEPGPGGRYGEWQDRIPGSSYGQRQDTWPGARYGQWQDPRHQPTYAERWDRMHGVSHFNVNSVAPLSETATLNGGSHSYGRSQLQLESLLTRLDHLDQIGQGTNGNFGGLYLPTNWNLHHQYSNSFDGLRRH